MTLRAEGEMMSKENSTSVAVGGCDAEGNRTLRLVSVVEPSSPNDQIQWLVDGEPFGPVMAPGPYEGKVPGDGAVHLLELRVISPEGVAGDTAEVKFPLCSQNVVGHIRSVDFAERQNDGSLPIRLVSKMEPEGTEATVQWLIDGEPLDGPVPAGLHTGSVQAAGGLRRVELRVLEPSDAQGDIEEVEFPGPAVAARIAVAEFPNGDPYITGSIAVEEFEDAEIRGIAVVELDEADVSRIAVEELDEAELATRIAVVELDEAEDCRIAVDDSYDGLASQAVKNNDPDPDPIYRITIDSHALDIQSLIHEQDKVKLIVSSGGRTGMAQWSLDNTNLGSPVPTPRRPALFLDSS